MGDAWISFHEPRKGKAVDVPFETLEGREWWLWGFAVVVTLALTLAIAGLVYPGLNIPAGLYDPDLRSWVRGLAGLVLIFDLYTVYQHLQLTRMRRQLTQRNRLFELISENAADMIAVVDLGGRRLYNSPAYQRVLGYSAQELENTSGIDQVHPDDRSRVAAAAERARVTGAGERLEYRIQHRDGSWRILESTASPISNAKGEIENLVIVNRDITERKRAEELLEYNALHDRLTRLPNRAHFLKQVERAVGFSQRHADYRFAVLFVGIDGFRLINESLGHDAGDKLLIQLGVRLKGSLREMDVVARPGPGDPAAHGGQKDEGLARLGGDEFAVMVDDIRHPTDAVRIARRLQEAIRTPFQFGDGEVAVSVSVGIVLNRGRCTSAQDLLRDSEIAMHRAKAAGKSRFEVFDAAMHAQAVRRLQTEAEIRRGIARGEFKVHYQPIVSLSDGRIVGLEALSRWQRSDRLALPSEFIEIADETGLIAPINRQLLSESCQYIKKLQDDGRALLLPFLSVNIPPHQFADPGLVESISTVLEQTKLDPGLLHLEIVETVAMGDPEIAGKILEDLKALGIRLTIDDFGIGYSSLSRLQNLPVQELKIDRSFIRSIENDPTIRDVVQTIVQLAHRLRLHVVAEGVESQAQEAILKRMGCEFAQGFYYSRPADADSIAEAFATINLRCLSDSRNHH